MKIHVVGDSHVLIFSSLEPFVVNHIGPFTAYKLKEKKEFWDYIARIEKGDRVIMSFGEIDCRVHASQQQQIPVGFLQDGLATGDIGQRAGRSMGEVITDIIERYDEVLSTLKERGIDFAVYNIVPPTGRAGDVVKIKEDFNKALKQKCDDKGYKFIDVLSNIVDSNGQVKPELRGAIDHLNIGALPFILPEIERLFGPKLFEAAGKPASGLVATYVPIELVAYYEEFRGYYPKCEMGTKSWFVHNIRRDWVILDCGANIGYYTILFAKLAPDGVVFAFEPTSTYDMLLTNLAHYHLENVKPLKLALGKSSGDIEDSIYRVWGKEPEKMLYPFTTIDDFVNGALPRLDCIKIDVDSYDLEALQGAAKTLKQYNPFVVVELNEDALSLRSQSMQQAADWLVGQGYEHALSLGESNFLLKRG